MLDPFATLALTVVGVMLLDGFVRPHGTSGLRNIRGLWLLACLCLTVFGALFGLSGHATLAAVLTLAVHAVLVVASNAKLRVLGEPLVFSDLALIGAMFRHPQFYFSVLNTWQKIAGLAAGVGLIGLLGWLARPALEPFLTGLAMAVAGLAGTAISFRFGLFDNLARKPDLVADVARLGLVPSLVLYWRRWRESRDGASPVASDAASLGQDPPAGQLVVVVQCESFADPVELFGNPEYALPSLEAARLQAVQWGNLQVSGFGAYTMRTEYGVLFGRDEAELGFRLFDPYLTAIGDAAHALPNKLGTDRWHSLFVHPHDMRFYNRDRIMPVAGFAELVGDNHFADAPRSGGRYVTDAAVAERILDRAAEARGSAFLYCVTIENHGPWAAQGDAGPDAMIANYNRLVRAGDAMLDRLQNGIAALERPSLLVFFGDHRPSIPGASVPGGNRDTPYVIIKFDRAGRIIPGQNRRVDLTPAQLHHAILALHAADPE